MQFVTLSLQRLISFHRSRIIFFDTTSYMLESFQNLVEMIMELRS